jgi:signal peptidase II
MKAKHRWFAVSLVLSLIADQATKIWARQALRPTARVIHVIDGYFELQYTENTGSAFSFLQGRPEARWLLFGVGVLALGLVAHWLRQAAPEARRLALWLGLLAGGAVGNLVDRAWFGHVTDFIRWKVQAYAWPYFNVADAALVVGIGGLFLDLKAAPARAAADRSA